MRQPVPSLRRIGITRDPAAPSLISFVTDWLSLEVSLYQRTLLKVLDAAPRLTGAEFEAFKQATHRHRYVPRRYPMACVVCGARSGKDSRIAVPLLLYHALFVDHRASVGESLIFPLLAQDKLGAQTAFNYAQGYLKSLPVLNEQVEEYLTDEIRLTNGRVIRCYPATAAAVSGISAPMGILDEVAFLERKGRDSDLEIQTSLFSRMATFPHKSLIKISTPRTPDGVLWQDMQRLGEDSERLLVWRAPTAAMNPSIDLSAYKDLMDPARFAREFEAEFSDATEEYITLSMISRCVDVGIPEREINTAKYRYYVGVDVSLGGTDWYALCVCHFEDDKVVMDYIHGDKTNDQNGIDRMLDHIAETARRYFTTDVYGDAAGGSAKFGPIAKEISKRGFRYITPKKRDEAGQMLDSTADKTTLYNTLQFLVNGGNILLLDNPAMPFLRQATLLQRKENGKVDVWGGNDDFVNALAVAAYITSTGSAQHKPVGMSLGAPSRSGGAFGAAIGGTQPGGGQVEHIMGAYPEGARRRPMGGWGGWR